MNEQQATKTKEQVQDQAEEKAKQLSQTHGKVDVLLVYNNDDYVVGYLKQPNREAKRAVMDMMFKSITAAGKMYLECALIKEESDQRMTSPLPENDAVVMGAETACISYLEIYQSEIKKK